MSQENDQPRADFFGKPPLISLIFVLVFGAILVARQWSAVQRFSRELDSIGRRRESIQLPDGRNLPPMPTAEEQWRKQLEQDRRSMQEQVRRFGGSDGELRETLRRYADTNGPARRFRP